MALTDEMIERHRELSSLGSKIIKARDDMARIMKDISRLQAERSALQAQLQSDRQQFQTEWDALRNG